MPISPRTNSCHVTLIIWMGSLCRASLLASSEVIEIFDELGFHFLARNDGINEAVIEQKFSSLKTRWKFRLGSVFDDTRTGKTDHSAWFGDDKITNTGIAGHDSRGGRIGQNTDERQTGFGMVSKGATSLGHLHEAEHPFVHTS